MLEINKPFDVVDHQFTEDLRHPERLSNEVKLYSQLGMFATLEKLELSSLLDQLAGKPQMASLKATMRYGAWLCKEIGMPALTGQKTFPDKMSSFDPSKVEWGLRILSALQVDEIAEQAWAVDRAIGTHHCRTDWEWTGAYDHRIVHGISGDPECRAEHNIAYVSRNRAAFDKSLTETVRDRMWESFWSRNRAAPNFTNAVSDFFQETLKSREEENEALREQEKRDTDEVMRDDLTYQMVTKLEKAGIRPGRW